MATNLPTDIAGSYPDRSQGDRAHQQHHDTVHGALNELSATVETGRLSEGALSATYGPPGGYSTLSSPVVIGHRGTAGSFPEETMEGFRAAVAGGVKVLELDVRRLKSGGLAVMHDATVDRTTSSTGEVTSFTAAGWAQLNIDAGDWFGYGWANDLKPPLLTDMLREFGNKVVLAIEAIGSDTGALVTKALQDHKISTDHAIVTAYNYTELEAPKAAGYRVGLVTDNEDPATMIANGVDIVGIQSVAAGDAYIQSVVAAGLDAWVATINRHYLRDAYAAMGVRGLYSDEPVYLLQDTAPTATDTFTNQTVNHGWLVNSPGDRGEFVAPNEWGWSLTNQDFRAVLLGDLSPFPSGDSFTLDFSVRWVSAAQTTSWVAVYLAAKDRNFNNDGTAGDYGYLCLARKNGTLQIYRIDNGVSTQIRSVVGTDTADGTTATYRITVTPTDLTLARLDVATEASQPDATYRGLKYATFGRYGVHGYFKDIAYAEV